MGGGVGGRLAVGVAATTAINIVATPCCQTVSWLVVSSLGLLCLVLAVPGTPVANGVFKQLG